MATHQWKCTQTNNRLVAKGKFLFQITTCYDQIWEKYMNMIKGKSYIRKYELVH